MSDTKPLDLAVADLVLIGQYGKFSILYQPGLDRWHGVIPAQGQSTDRIEKALVHYFAENRNDLCKKLDKHKVESFERFTVLEAPEFLARQGGMFEHKHIAPKRLEVTSQAADNEYWMRDEGGNRMKRYLNAYHADTPENLVAMNEMAQIAQQAKALHDRYIRLRDSMRRAEVPVSPLDRILGDSPSAV